MQDGDKRIKVMDTKKYRFKNMLLRYSKNSPHVLQGSSLGAGGNVEDQYIPRHERQVLPIDRAVKIQCQLGA